MGNKPHKQVSRARVLVAIKGSSITAETAGRPIKQLVDAAMASDDPLGYVSTFAVAPAEDEDKANAPPPAPAEDEDKANAPPPASPPARERFREVTITLPLDLDGCPGYVPRHVEAGNLPDEQGRALAYLRDGLKHQGTRLANGKPIWHLADVVRYFLEQVDAALSAE